MRCKQCKTIFPGPYKECPNCKSTDFEAVKFKQNFMSEEDTIDPIDPFVVCSTLDDAVDIDE